MNLIRCTQERHAGTILEILNEAILNSTALFDYQPRKPEAMVAWFEAKERGGYPVIGVESGDGKLMGFASYGSFRAWPAYKYSVEHSVYVHRDHRGRGLGRILMRELISAAEEQGYHAMIGGIEAGNAGSIALHESLAFTHAGTIREAGFKFGRWLDLSFYQLILRTPAEPCDG
ncbi:GNAT family N-acetyltransferase [Luteolibacter sp. GHJ8]|uniref:GNAT family N-acetyltransferase n=1 Tax=Luteolibacter rhizosphaerae TaxID=2989719 RepID=A0ABT3GAP8_9BACT|nr:GNAT family N-acetyltransferase [Luteolibacter rhizosphaerae]MCW1916559.1 GNAT family N-acetyltransferase [Luteolibacter rhizosphaerae]